MKTSRPHAMLVFFHCGTNNGYSITMWEDIFWNMALNVVGASERIHFAYATMENGWPKNLEPGTNVLQFDSHARDPASLEAIREYIQRNRIDIAFGFDQPVRRPAYRTLRQAGIRTFLSYLGAPVSSLNTGLILLAKKLEVRLSRHQPDFYIFQSRGMAQTATHGRGIPPKRTIVCPSGVDADRYRPGDEAPWYAHDAMGIPRDRHIVFYAGHMERRKGVDVIMQAAIELIEQRGRRDVHFLLVGNHDGLEEPYLRMLTTSPARDHVTFGGYRADVPALLRSAWLGVIASTGWDSFPLSGLEMAASGLPVIVSDIPGLNEVVVPGVTGELFPPGNAAALADAIERYLMQPALRTQHSVSARARIVGSLTTRHVIERLTRIVLGAHARTLDGRKPLYDDFTRGPTVRPLATP